MDELKDAINWWEDELDGDKRRVLLHGKAWDGSIREREERLLSLYRARPVVERKVLAKEREK